MLHLYVYATIAIFISAARVQKRHGIWHWIIDIKIIYPNHVLIQNQICLERSFKLFLDCLYLRYIIIKIQTGSFECENCSMKKFIIVQHRICDIFICLKSDGFCFCLPKIEVFSGHLTHNMCYMDTSLHFPLFLVHSLQHQKF